MMEPVYPSRRARSLYSRLLFLFPGWFRKLYAAEMVDDFDELFRTVGSSRSFGARIKCWGVVLRDLAVSATRERFSSGGGGSSPSSSPPDDAGDRGEFISSLFRDVRYAVRSLRRQPGFSVVVVATLALGLGSNIAMFSVIDGVLLSSLPYPDADRLVMVWNRHVNTGADKVQIGADYLDYRERASSFEELAFIHNAGDITLTDGPPEPASVGGVSVNFFQFLGLSPLLGRTFTTDDETRASGSGSPIIISHGLWSRRYGADQAIIGRVLEAGASRYEVIGVMPADFDLVLPEHDGGQTGGGATGDMDTWVMMSDRVFASLPRSLALIRVLGRLTEAATVASAQQEMDGIAEQLRGEHRVHEERGMQIDLVPLHADVVGSVKAVVLSLFGAVGFVLLIACANVANLVLVRGARRQREVALRAALGAKRSVLVRHVFVENVILAVAGTAVGLLMAVIAVKTIVALAPSNVPLMETVSVDGNVLWFAVAAAVVATLLFGLVPAFKGAAPDVANQLCGAPRGATGSSHRMRSGIAVAEISLSLVLLIGSSLMIRSFLELQGAGLGFEAASALTVKVALPRGQYDDPAVRATFWNGLRREVANAPGVEDVGFVWPLPFAGRGFETPYASTGGESADWGRFVAAVSYASPGFFEAMEARVIDGRAFTDADIEDARPVTVVDEIVAQRLFGGERAVGRTVWLRESGSPEKVPIEIVGVVAHMRHESVMGLERESIYRPTAGDRRMAMVVRTGGDPLALLGSLRRVAASLDPEIPLFDEGTFADYISDEIAPTRFTMTLASVFAFIALVLASVGLYGVIAYSVAQRARELGVRMALGAHEGMILRLVLGHGLTLAAAGIGLGLVVSLGLTRAIRSLLFGVTPTDPLTFVGVSLLLGAVALVASYVPARRAARADPLTALRAE